MSGSTRESMEDRLVGQGDREPDIPLYCFGYFSVSLYFDLFQAITTNTYSHHMPGLSNLPGAPLMPNFLSHSFPHPLPSLSCSSLTPTWWSGSDRGTGSWSWEVFDSVFFLPSCHLCPSSASTHMHPKILQEAFSC